MSFVGKSKRGKKDQKDSFLSQTYVKDIPKINLSQKQSEQQNAKNQIQQISFFDKPKSNRNLTHPLAMDWSWKEDTYRNFQEKYSTKQPLTTEIDDFENGFERPSRKNIYHAESIKNDLYSNGSNNPLHRKEMSQREIRIWRSDNQVIIKAKMRISTPPLLEWTSPPLQAELVESLVQSGFNTPRLIQSVAIPISLEGYDILGMSHPGTGKTLAYVIPLISHILSLLSQNDELNMSNSPLGVVLVPTHELAVQVEDVIRQIGQSLGILTKLITGSVKINEQALDMGKIYHIVISTPGRLNDAIESNIVLLHHVHHIVIDEADKMVDKSLGPQITKILEQTPKEKCIQMYSATMPHEIFVIIEKYFTKYVQISIGTNSDTVKQVVHYVSEDKRNEMICRILHGMKSPIIVFCNSRDSCEQCASFLGSSGFRVAMIHGGKSQSERDELVERINEDIFDILVATDVLSRGIDIPNIMNVVNYEVPTDIRTYVHRIGRTGRNGASGVATSIVTPKDKEIMYDLTKLLQHGNFAVPQEMLQNQYAKTRFIPKE